MNVYEMTFLLNKEDELKNIKKIVTSSDGKVVSEESWGTKTLRYPIKKQLSAKFYSWQIELDGANLSDIKNKLNLTENLIRYLFLKVDPREVIKAAKAPKIKAAVVEKAPVKEEVAVAKVEPKKIDTKEEPKASKPKVVKVAKKSVAKAKK